MAGTVVIITCSFIIPQQTLEIRVPSLKQVSDTRLNDMPPHQFNVPEAAAILPSNGPYLKVAVGVLFGIIELLGINLKIHII